jgi:hypothetical protein
MSTLRITLRIHALPEYGLAEEKNEQRSAQPTAAPEERLREKKDRNAGDQQWRKD